MKDTARLVDAYARALVRTRLFEGTPLSAVPKVARHVLRGNPGPSTIFRIHATIRGDQVAAVCRGRRITYQELDTRIDRLAAGLQRVLDIRSGHAVVLMLENRLELLESQVALSRLGAAAVPVSYRSRPEELAYLLHDSEARACITERTLLSVARSAAIHSGVLDESAIVTVGSGDAGAGVEQLEDQIAPDLNRQPLRYEDLLSPEHRSRCTGQGVPFQNTDADPGRVIIYTSGTTGKPKGAVREFPRSGQEGILRFLAEAPLRTGERHLTVCPMYHSTAYAFTSFAMLLGGTVVIKSRFDPEDVLETIMREGIQSCALVPTMLYRLVSLPERIRSRYDTRTLRGVFTAGAPLSGTLAREFIDSFGPVLYNLFGSTETGLNTLATPEELLRSPGTIGHPIRGNEFRLLDSGGRPVGPGEVGELYIRNSMLVSGYHRNPEATAASMRDGFFSVGDLARQDRHGLFHL
ncbi:MAG: long-chain fatty acid--CoA ligase, partial [Myxococcota bacterium]